MGLGAPVELAVQGLVICPAGHFDQAEVDRSALERHPVLSAQRQQILAVDDQRAAAVLSRVDDLDGV